ncbi:MAG: hypothetical protein QNJ67_18055 [Kiloniellales bacterium]|nr:hypothetical protein [Kiloniellales bacterium]
MSNCPRHGSGDRLARWRPWLAALLLVPASAGAAVARDLCAEIAPLIALASSPADPESRGASSAEVARLGEASCRVVTRPSGGISYCTWTFPYRSDEAAAAFEDFADQLESCFKPEAAQGGGPGVNHPDSYAQHRYTAGPASISLSLKDKAALDSTYVSVIVSGRK